MVLQIIDGFENYLIFEPQQFQSFDYFMNEFVDDGNLIIFEIVKFGQFFFFSIWKTKIWSQKLANFGFVCPFDIPHYS